MRTGIVAFLIGNISLLYWPVNQWPVNQWLVNQWPDAQSIVLLVCLLLALTVLLYKALPVFVSSSRVFLSILVKKAVIIILAFLFGFMYTLLYVSELYPVLDLEQIEGKTIEVKGYLDSIPNKNKQRQSFNFFITARKNTSKNEWDTSFNGKVKLSWYHTFESLQSGQQWQLKIRLKKPSGLLNGDFDYEKWLYQNRILATGYVRSGHQLISHKQSSIQSYLVNSRQKVANRLDKALYDYPYKGLVKALAIGIRHEIEPEQWQAFLRTGTNHLIAISGLHIGLMSSFIWLIVYTLWRSIGSLNLRLPALYVASSAALIAAIMYAALAGFAIPTQRALIMLSVVFIAIILRREFLPSYILLLAFLAVVIFDPLSALSPGFWLSFGAVAVILFIVSARLAVNTNTKNKLIQFGWLQLAIFIGLLPPLLILFHQFSLISPLANLFAVPLMSLVIVPMTLFASALIFIAEPVGIFVFNLLQFPVNLLFWSLNSISEWSGSLVYLAKPSLLVALMVIAGSFWLLMPKGWHGRWLGIILIVPVFFAEAEKIPQGQVQLTLLDVGQGLAMVLRTSHHTLLYDTGDKYSEQFNMADKAIIPYLRLQGISKINKLVVSHSDRDHAGSYANLIGQLTVETVLAGEPKQLSVNPSSKSSNNETIHQLPGFTIEQCTAGMKWVWDEVKFEVLSPIKPLLIKKKNNRSCVLLITTAINKTILLTGDIEKKAEKQLLNEYPELKADILQVPHHGSRTSSSAAFLKQLQPEIALFSFGYRNRFHHPSDKVVSRYKRNKIKLYNTSNGAIDIQVNMTNNSFSVTEYRVAHQRLWHREIKML